nr:hypothetical protein [Tanacetum cinerariifolium]
MDDNLFTYEVDIPGLSYISCDVQQVDDSDDGDLGVYEKRVCFDENESVYVEAGLRLMKNTKTHGSMNRIEAYLGFLENHGFCNGGELPGMIRVGYMTYFQDYEWYNLIDGKLKEEALKQNSIYEGSCGDATQGVLNFCAWLKECFGNFHELDYELMIEFKEYWWAMNDNKCSSFTDLGNRLHDA